MTRPLDCAIAVPVRNEAERLPSLLFALARQRGASPFALCIHFDSCTDDSRAVVQVLAPTLPYRVIVDQSETATPPNAGRARAAAGVLALSQGPRAILNTDADSEPVPDWVATNVAALEQADLVAGRILLPSAADTPAQVRLTAYYDRLHRHRRRVDPVAWEDGVTHHWTSASSLAVRVEAYRALNGFASLPRGEDADLADRAWRAGYRLRRDARVAVRTSARRNGRAEGGFAAMLAAMDTSSALPRVAHPDDEEWRYRHHAEARRCFVAGDVRLLGRSLHLDPIELERIAAAVPNAEAFVARVVGAPPGGMRSVSLGHAEVALNVLDADLLEGVA